MDWKLLYGTLKAVNWLLLLFLSLLSFFLMSSTWTLGVMLGGLITIANFSLLQHTVKSVFASRQVDKAAKVMIVAKYYFRLLGLGAILFVIITRGWVDPVGLALGLSIVVFSIVGVGIRLAFKTSTGEAI